MLIFDTFKSEEQAKAFGLKVRENYPDRNTYLCQSQADSNKIDPFPFELIPPIVLVGRTRDYDKEKDIIELVKQFDGVYAGT